MTTSDDRGRSWSVGEQSNWLWYSHDHGDNWSEPVPTPVVGIVPDQLLELQHGEHRGRWLLTAHTRLQPVATPLWTVRTWSSDDGGTSWQGPHKIAEVPGLQLCEPTLVELDTGEVIAFLRENSGQG